MHESKYTQKSKVFFYRLVKDTSKESWQMFCIVILLITFSPGNENDSQEEKANTFKSRVFEDVTHLLSPDQSWQHCVGCWMLPPVGVRQQDTAASGTVCWNDWQCSKKNMNTTGTAQNQHKRPIKKQDVVNKK